LKQTLQQQLKTSESPLFHALFSLQAIMHISQAVEHLPCDEINIQH
jgi:hypothetical protein